MTFHCTYLDSFLISVAIPSSLFRSGSCCYLKGFFDSFILDCICVDRAGIRSRNLNWLTQPKNTGKFSNLPLWQTPILKMFGMNWNKNKIEINWKWELFRAYRLSFLSQIRVRDREGGGGNRKWCIWWFWECICQGFESIFVIAEKNPFIKM